MGAPKQQTCKLTTPRPVPFAHTFEVLAQLVVRIARVARIEERAVALRGGAEIHIRYAALQRWHGAEREYLLTVARERPHLRPDTEVAIVRARKPIATARVLRVEGRSLWVSTEKALEPFDDLSLRSATDWLWAAVRRRLRELWPEDPCARVGPVVPNDALILDALNARSRKRPRPLAHIASANLSPEQRSCVRSILRDSVTYLWGPPGTGKTTTLAEAVRALVQADCSVLVVGPSNAAADVATGWIADILANHPAFDRGLLVRHGDGAGSQLRAAWDDRVLAAEIAERLEREAAHTPTGDPSRYLTRAAALEKAIARVGAVGGARLRESGRRVVRSLRLRGGAPRPLVCARISAESILSSAQVVVTTAHQLCFTSGASRMYDTVIVDEAGQASLPLVLLAAAHAREAIVIAGDPRQLSPTVVADTDEVKRLLGKDVFTLSGAVSAAGSSAAHMLVDQHRMPPGVSALVSELFYEGRLRPHLSVRDRRVHPIRRRHGSLLFVDTGYLEPCACRASGSSRINREHLSAIRELTASLSRRGLLPRSTSLMLVTPYRAQADRLSRAVPLNSASTVHAYQGGEADVVVLDLTDARGAPISRFLQATHIGDEGARLLNVAASRARQVLIVVADFSYLESAGGAVVRAFLRHVRTQGTLLDLDLARNSAHGHSRRAAGTGRFSCDR